MRLENPFTRRPYPDLCFPNGSYNMSAACWKFVTDAQGPFHSVKNNTYMPILMRHYPGGSSIGQLVHFGQLIIRGDGFYKYDYGVERNLELYGTVYPPAYNLTNVQSPMFIFYCKNDYQAHYKDVKKLAADLPGLAGIFLTPAETFNHLDIMYEEAAADLVYRRLIDQMTKYR
ncbi:lipase 1-like [Frankliniella occidentalis]|uniref:Lipase 1-like n=1 Tax=Frankliniella occidentalis TaxID=133901 RepID=A0A9C6X0Z9_FRAOC|nr:lipase 1-like [Frankliniella occidentalis]